MTRLNRKSFLAWAAGAAASLYTGACKRAAPREARQSASNRAEELANRVFEHNTIAAVVAAAYIGDRLGLFRAMSGAGPLTARQVADKTGLDRRYVLEWLRVMATAKYIEYRPATRAFELPREYTAVFADEDSPYFSGGLFEGTVADVTMSPRVMSAFRSGKGIPYGEYPPDTFESIERSTRPDYLHLLTQHWLPAVPGAMRRLEAGGTAADLGSGAGLASIAIAKAFPAAKAFGFEPYAPSVARARRNAEAAGVGGRVKFDTFDGVNVPGGPYDLVTINYSLHHAGDPVGLMRSAKSVLAPGGAFFIVEYRKSADLRDDIGTPRQMAYAYGLLECVPTALAEGGPGYGTGITESDVRDLARRAGFSQFARVLPDDPIRSFFLLRA